MKLTFYGGAKYVTGANYLLDTGDLKILVDCGLFQGSKYAEVLNYEKFSFNPAEVDFLLITHSHTDHIGRIPKLFKEGFRGRILATQPAIDLAKNALPNTLSLIKEEAHRDNHEPLFDNSDVQGSLALCEGYGYGQPINLSKNVQITFHDAGHILGSAIIEVHVNDSDKRIFFTGDLGNPPTPLLNAPSIANNADYIVIESAYGDRVHEDRSSRRQILENIIDETVARGGTLVIPSFAMERTQELLYEINDLLLAKRIPGVPVFVDSPLAISLTEVYRNYSAYFNKDAKYLIDSGDDIFNFPGLTFTKTTEESKQINNIAGPKIIIAGSGMSNGGRILFHEQRYLPDPKAAILFVGYQVKGSLGRRILDHATEVTIMGHPIQIRCKVRAIGGYSAHADQKMLLSWVRSAAEGGNLKKVFVVQGEEDASLALAHKIKADLKIDAVVPVKNEIFEV